MANKEFEMLFKLGAKLGENFTGTFNSAQKVLQQTEKEIQAMNRLQADVGSYQKQQQSIEKTNDKLNIYQKQLEAVREKMASTGESSSNLAIKEETLKAKIKDTEYVLAQKNTKLAQMSEKLTTAGVDVTKLTDESKRLQTEMRELQKQEMQAATEAEKFGNKGTSAIEAIGTALVSAGIGTAIGKIKDEFLQCNEIAMQFDATMSTVAALSGASAEQMNTLSSTAKELGASTVFTANQTAQAMTYMGMAGWDAQQMVSGMDGVLNLAAASGEDLASVSDIVTDNLTAFGLTAQDTAHFSDVLAAAATNSNTSVGIMGETFKSSASIAGALGYSIEDVATAVGLMANSGVKGSIAGTALKNTFNGLLNGATLTGAAIGEVEYTAIKSDGTLKSFGETIDELRGYFERMTEAERVQNAMTLAGQRGYNGLLAILNSTDADYQKLSDSITNCAGSAQKMANIKLDNLQGDVTLLKSAADGLKMTIGGMYDKELRQLAELGTKILNDINEFCAKNPVLVKTIVTAVATLGGLLTVYTAINAAKKIKNALDTLGISLTAAHTAGTAKLTFAESAHAVATNVAAAAQGAWNAILSASPIFIFTAVLVGVTAALAGYREATKKASIEEGNLNIATKEQNDRVSQLQTEYDKAVDSYGAASDKARALKYDLDEATAAVEEQTISVSDLYAKIDTAKSAADDFVNSIHDSTDEINGNYESAQILISKLRELTTTSDNSATSHAKIEPIIDRLNELYPNLGLTLDNVKSKMSGLNSEVEKTANSELISQKIKNAKDSYADLAVKVEESKKLWEQAEKVRLEAGKRFNEEFDNANWFEKGIQAINPFGSAIKDAEKELDTAQSKEQDAYETYAKYAEEYKKAGETLEEYAAISEGTSDQLVSLSDAVSIATDDVADSVEALITSYNNAYKAAYDSISGQYALWDDAAEVAEIDVEDINDSIQSQTDYWNAYSDNIDKLLQKSNRISGLKDMISTFSDGSKDSVDAIAGMAGASDSDLADMVKSWQSLQKAQEKASGSLADVRVDFNEQLDQIENDMGDRIDKMLSKDDEAKSAAKTMIDAYCQALISGKGSVADAASIVGNAAAAALAGATAYDTAHAKTAESAKASDASATNQLVATSTFNQSRLAGPVQSIPNLDYDNFFKNYNDTQNDSNEVVVYDKNGNAVDAASLFNSNGMIGYASGTTNARAGLAIVGENGPELVNFNGGESVLTAKKTADVLSGGSMITIAPVFQITGSADQSTLSECADKIVEMVKNALREEGIDAQRNAYA